MRYLNNWAIELSDFDISKSTTQIAHLIANLTLEHMVVVIRNQNLTPEQQINFCSKIGTYQSTDTDRAKDISLTDGVLRVTGQKIKEVKKDFLVILRALDWHANQASNYERKPLIWLYGAEGTKR